jgi:small subunit ribosomal protein S16
MSVKIRLQRLGRKKAPYYHIVVADSRAPRDGKFIENIGYYQPQTVPATIEVNVDKAMQWLNNGAQPTDTCRAILSYKGVMMKRHLQIGVTRGALTQEQADEKFSKWMEEKTSKVDAHVERQKKSVTESKADKLAAEAKVNEARMAKLAERLAAEEKSKKDAEQAASEPEVTETPSDETTEAPVAEETTNPAE